MSVSVKNAVIWEDSTPTFMARVAYDNSGVQTNLTQAVVSSITWTVYDKRTSIGSGTLTVADVIFDALQTGTTWTAAGGDSTGYNFKTKLANTNFPEGGKNYRVKFRITLTTGDVGFIGYNASTQPVEAT